MTRLSVNINKIATLRNARGGNVPDLIKMAIDCERFGAQGITVHPRPDERHIRYKDVGELKRVLKTELNIEGNPFSKGFQELVLQTKPAQVTLVPDENNQLTSDHGWDVLRQKDILKPIVHLYKNEGIRVSIFIDPIPECIEAASQTGADRIELYTESYALKFPDYPEESVHPYRETAKNAKKNGVGVNAGHDLNLKNLGFFAANIPGLLEVSIGHALIADALYFGMENAIRMYRNALEKI